MSPTIILEVASIIFCSIIQNHTLKTKPISKNFVGHPKLSKSKMSEHVCYVFDAAHFEIPWASPGVCAFADMHQQAQNTMLIPGMRVM